MGGEPLDFSGHEASVISSSAPGSPVPCPRCCVASSAPRRFGCVASGVESPVAHGLSVGWPVPVSGADAVTPCLRGGALTGSSPHPLFGSRVGRGSPWPRVRGVLSPK